MNFTSKDGNTAIECSYDYMGRRHMKKVPQNGTVASHERYLYRGYLQIAALNMLDNRNVLRTLLWDPLEPVATRPLALVQDASLYCYGVDFNKNVSEVFDAQGTIAAAYDYSPMDRWLPRAASYNPSTCGISKAAMSQNSCTQRLESSLSYFYS